MPSRTLSADDGIVTHSLESPIEDRGVRERHQACIHYTLEGLRHARPEDQDTWREVLAFHQLALL